MYNIKYIMEKLGTDYGGWLIPKNISLNENSIVYLGGAGEDISFDLKLQDKYNCWIVIIDPTKKAIKLLLHSSLPEFGLTRTPTG